MLKDKYILTAEDIDPPDYPYGHSEFQRYPADSIPMPPRRKTAAARKIIADWEKSAQTADDAVQIFQGIMKDYSYTADLGFGEKLYFSDDLLEDSALRHIFHSLPDYDDQHYSFRLARDRLVFDDMVRRVRAGITGRTVLVTGASSARGAEIAWQFAKPGARLVLLDSEANEKKLKSIQASLAKEFGCESMIVTCDLDKPADVFFEKQLARPVSRAFGHLDVVVLSDEIICGIAPLSIIDTVNMQKSLEYNVMGPLYMIRALHPLLKQSDKADVIFTVPAFDGKKDKSAYYASKSAIREMAHCYAAENEGTNIHVNMVSLEDTQGKRPGKQQLANQAFVYAALGSTCSGKNGYTLSAGSYDNFLGEYLPAPEVIDLDDPKRNYDVIGGCSRMPVAAGL